MIRPIIVVAHAAFNEARRAAFAPLRENLQEQCKAAGIELFVYEDQDALGSLNPWLFCLKHGTASDATHVTFLPDDAILVPHFVEVLIKAIEAHPDQILCFQSNHADAPRAAEEGAAWYTTPDGFTAFGGTMPVAWVKEHLEWRRDNIRGGVVVQGDEGVNLWAMATGRLIYKSLPSLVDHDLSLPSLDGNDHHITRTARRPLVWEPERDLRDHDWTGQVLPLIRTYIGNHWRLITDLVKPEIEAAYLADRNGEPVSEVPHVCICTPAYGGIELGYLNSRDHVISDMVRGGIKASIITTLGDSLVTRGRHCLMHQFLQTPATHLLFWDSDVECLTHEAVRMMIASGHDVVGGAYPFRDGSKKVVVNLREEDVTGRKLTVEPDGCCPVAEIGTGFLLISRKAIVQMCEAYPETFYLADCPPLVGAPMWALFDVGIIDRRYYSEDWLFCRRWQKLGGTVYCYTVAKLKHWGVTAHDGDFFTAFNLKRHDDPHPKG